MPDFLLYVTESDSSENDRALLSKLENQERLSVFVQLFKRFRDLFKNGKTLSRSFPALAMVHLTMKA
jgi:hypothetical protein